MTPDEMTGSTLTVTNLGMFGIDFFSGIINPPNAAILSVGASLNKPVLDSNGNLQAGERMTLGLSCDHRLVDGAAGAFFEALARFWKDPLPCWSSDNPADLTIPPPYPAFASSTNQEAMFSIFPEPPFSNHSNWMDFCRTRKDNI